MRRIVVRSIAFVAALSVLLLSNSGCFHHRVNRHESGDFVNGRDFAHIKPGVSGSWVQAMLGKPSEIRKTDGGSEIWEWRYSRVKTVDGQILFISTDSSVTYHRQARVEVKDGVVKNKWFDDRDVTTKLSIQ